MAFGDSFSLPLVGSPVNNAQGEEIGLLSDVVFDAAEGRLRFLVIQLRNDGSQVIVPWDAFTFRPGDPVVLPVTPAELDAIPHLAGHLGHDASELQRDLRLNGAPGYPPFATLTEPRERSTGAGQVVLGAFALIVCAALGYGLYLGLSPAKATERTRVAVVLKDTAREIRETSADATTTAKVKTALALSKRVPASDVNVDTTHRVATLTGRVPSEEVRDAAGEIAADTSGVRDVRNLLTVSAAPSQQ